MTAVLYNKRIREHYQDDTCCDTFAETRQKSSEACTGRLVFKEAREMVKVYILVYQSLLPKMVENQQ